MASNHTEHLHTHRLNSLCRVCGGRSRKTAGPDTSKSWLPLASLLNEHFGDIIPTQAVGKIVLTTVCAQCCARLYSIKNAVPVHLQTNLTTVRCHLEISNKIWTVYNPSIPEAKCSVCQTYLASGKANKLTNKKRTGRLQGTNQAKTDSTSEMSDCSSEKNDEANQSSIKADCSIGDASTGEWQQEEFKPMVCLTPQVKLPVNRCLVEFLEEPGHSASNITDLQQKAASTSDASTSSQYETSITELQQEPKESSAPQVSQAVKRKLCDFLKGPGHKIAKMESTSMTAMKQLKDRSTQTKRHKTKRHKQKFAQWKKWRPHSPKPRRYISLI